MEEDPVVGPLAVAEDHAGVRSALRKLGVERIVATPDETGWQFEGLCNLSRLVSNKGVSAPSEPPPRIARAKPALEPRTLVASSQQRAQERAALVARPLALADRLADEPALAVDEKHGGRVGDLIALLHFVVPVEKHGGGHAAALHPPGDQIGLFAEIDRQHDEPLVLEISMDTLDGRGQLPRTIRSGALPEVEHDGPAAHVAERDRLAVERGELERRRALVAERRHLKRREQIIETVVGSRRQQRDCDEEECPGELTA
jgi:hypothetical protein